MTLIKESPEIFDFPLRMEASYPNTFFRGNKSTLDLFSEFEKLSSNFVFFGDETVFQPELDLQGDCGESCEIM